MDSADANPFYRKTETSNLSSLRDENLSNGRHFHMSGKYVKSRPPMRGGWDVGPDEYKALGFTVGLPPNIYVNQTPDVIECSERFEKSDEQFRETDSLFAVQERQVLFQTGHFYRCYVRDIPMNIPAEKLKEILNQKCLQMRVSSSPNAIYSVSIEKRSGIFAFVEFTKAKEFERFLALKNSLEINGHTVTIKQSNMLTNVDVASKILPTLNTSCLIWNDISPKTTQEQLKQIVSEFAGVRNLTIPKIDNVSLGFAIIELEDPLLADYTVFKIKHILGGDCSRCYPKLEQEPRKQISSDKIEEMKKYGVNSSLYSILDQNLPNLSVAHILNLDINISTLIEKPPVNESYTKLRIFNVIKSDENKEKEIVLNDMREECEYYGEIVNCCIDLQWDNLVRPVFSPIIVEFASPEGASKAQNGISGRKYCGRTVITMLC